MKTAKDFAKAAADISQMATAMNPADTDVYADSRKLIVYHLRSAAQKAREIAEAKAGKEETPK